LIPIIELRQRNAAFLLKTHCQSTSFGRDNFSGEVCLSNVAGRAGKLGRFFDARKLRA
jgi:hypothetical protein